VVVVIVVAVIMSTTTCCCSLFFTGDDDLTVVHLPSCVVVPHVNQLIILRIEGDIGLAVGVIEHPSHCSMSTAMGNYSCICCSAVSLLGLRLLRGVKRGDSSSSEGSISRISLHLWRRRRTDHSMRGEESAVPYSVAARDEDLDDSNSGCGMGTVMI
jgi:hypothetical protein